MLNQWAAIGILLFVRENAKRLILCEFSMCFFDQSSGGLVESRETMISIKVLILYLDIFSIIHWYSSWAPCMAIWAWAMSLESVYRQKAIPWQKNVGVIVCVCLHWHVYPHKWSTKWVDNDIDPIKRVERDEKRILVFQGARDQFKTKDSDGKGEHIACLGTIGMRSQNQCIFGLECRMNLYKFTWCNHCIFSRTEEGDYEASEEGKNKYGRRTRFFLCIL